MLLTLYTHLIPPSNNPLILFIISQLFLVRAIHERNHSHKHAPMCRAAIQYKYTHFLISSQSSGPFCCFSSVLCYASVVQLHITIPHQRAASLKRERFASCICVWRVFTNLRRAHLFSHLIGFQLHIHTIPHFFVEHCKCISSWAGSHPPKKIINKYK